MSLFPREAASLNANSNHIQHRNDNYSQIKAELIQRKALSYDYGFRYGVNTCRDDRHFRVIPC
jgi:hypothetical protein